MHEWSLQRIFSFQKVVFCLFAKEHNWKCLYIYFRIFSIRNYNDFPSCTRLDWAQAYAALYVDCSSNKSSKLEIQFFLVPDTFLPFDITSFKWALQGRYAEIYTVHVFRCFLVKRSVGIVSLVFLISFH